MAIFKIFLIIILLQACNKGAIIQLQEPGTDALNLRNRLSSIEKQKMAYPYYEPEADNQYGNFIVKNSKKRYNLKPVFPKYNPDDDNPQKQYYYLVPEQKRNPPKGGFDSPLFKTN